MTWDEIVKQGYDQFMRRNEDLEYVVRCRDCRWHEDNFCGNFNVIGFGNDDFCSLGQRRDIEDEEGEVVDGKG